MTKEEMTKEEDKRIFIQRRLYFYHFLNIFEWRQKIEKACNTIFYHFNYHCRRCYQQPVKQPKAADAAQNGFKKCKAG